MYITFLFWNISFDIALFICTVWNVLLYKCVLKWVVHILHKRYVYFVSILHMYTFLVNNNIVNLPVRLAMLIALSTAHLCSLGKSAVKSWPARFGKELNKYIHAVFKSTFGKYCFLLFNIIISCKRVFFVYNCVQIIFVVIVVSSLLHNNLWMKSWMKHIYKLINIYWCICISNVYKIFLNVFI